MKRAAIAVLMMAVTVNIGAGLFLLRLPERTRDLRTVRMWASEWLLEGHDIYAPATSRVDYPPHAIVVLSPLSLIPGSAFVPLWSVFNFCLAIVAPILAVRLVTSRATLTDLAMVTALFLCWSGSKVLVQFTLLSVVAGLTAVVLADRRPHWSAIGLAVATMKPQIAAPFILWFLIGGRLLTIIESFLFVVGAALFFCIRVHATPTAVAIRYVEILRSVYTGTYQMVGASNLRPLIGSVFSTGVADVVAAATSLVLLLAICLFGLSKRHDGRRVMYAGLAMGAVWSLLSFYHLTYGFVLLLPTSALLFLDDNPNSWRLRRATFWVLQIVLIVDMPGVWRRVGPLLPGTAFDRVIPDFDRLVFLALLAALFAIAHVPYRAPSPSPAS